MSSDQVVTCLPGIAAVLAQAEGRIAQNDQAQADQRAQDRTPAGRLRIVYRSYVAVRECHRRRAGRALVYVTQDEAEDARRQARAIEQRLVRDNPTLDHAGLWAEAAKPAAPLPNDLLGMFANLDAVGRHDVEAGDFTENGRAYCGEARRLIEEHYREVYPENAAQKKDF